ncbi:MAG TPA: glycosyltransferase [Streptosporangiaceae bacterium]
MSRDGEGPGAAPDALRIATVITRLEGGAGQHALRGARAMNSDAFQMTIITGSGDRLLDEAAQAGLEVIIEPSLRTPIDPRSDLRALRRLGSLFRERHFDVVHTHTAKAGTAGRLAAHRAGIPRIVHTYHGFPFHEFQQAPRRRAYVAIERRLGQITDLALCVGTGVAVEAVRRELIAPERVRTIGVVVDGADQAGAGFPVAGSPGVAPLARRRARLALGLPADATVIGAVGRLTYQKAPEDFLAAMRRLGRPDVIGVWVGGGELAERIGRLAAAMPAGSVVLAGERTDVPELLPAFDVFALPSRYEGLPTVIVEAMVCGVPVVATAVNAVADVVIPGETGLLVPPRSPELMARAIAFLLDSPAVAAEMATAARARLGSRFGESALRGALTEAYTRQLSPSRGVPGGRPPGPALPGGSGGSSSGPALPGGSGGSSPGSAPGSSATTRLA